jgi:predicted transcriptional regulator
MKKKGVDMGRRCKTDIYAEILKLAKDGIRKTPLVYQANLNFTVLKKYLNILKEKEFIYISDDVINTTKEGLFFLEQYNEMLFAWNQMGTEESLSKPDGEQEVLTSDTIESR